MCKVIVVLDKPETYCPISDASIKVFLLGHIAQVPTVQRPDARHCISKVPQASTVIVAVYDIAPILANHVHAYVHSASVTVHVDNVAVSPQLSILHMLPTQSRQVQIVAESWNHLAEIASVSPYPFLQARLMIAFNENLSALVRQCAIEFVEPFAGKVAVISNGCFAAWIFVKTRELIEVEQVTKTHEDVGLKLFGDSNQTTNATFAFKRNMNIGTNKNSFHFSPKPEYHGGYMWGCA